MNNDIDAGTLRRAKKIYALAQNNPSAEEAARAMDQVQKMVAKYGMSYEDLKSDVIQKQFGESSGKSTKSAIPNWIRWLAASAANMTDTRAVRWYDRSSGYSMRFQGINGDDEVALMTMEYLLETCNRCLKAHKKEFGLKGAQVSLDFRRGFALEVNRRSNEMKKARKAEQESAQASESNGQSLAVVKRDLIEGHFTGVSRARKARQFNVRDGSSFGAGQDAGRSAGLNRQVSGSTQLRLS